MDKRLQDAPCGMIAIDEKGMILEVNRRFISWMMFAEEDVVGKSLDTFLSRAGRMFFHTYFYPTIHLDGYLEEFFTYLTDATGDSIPFLLNASKQTTNGKATIDIMFIQMKKRIDYEMELKKIQKGMKEAYRKQEDAYDELAQLHEEIQKKQVQLIEVNEELTQLSNTDKLTLLPNRRFFERELTHQINLYNNHQKPLSLIMFDIDHFKKINDTYGHLTGDHVLSQLASLLSHEIPQEATLARYGGEEFMVIFPNTNREEAIQFGHMLNQKVATHTWETIEHLTISVGITTMHQDDTMESFIERSDYALYASKENGRNRVTYFST